VGTRRRLVPARANGRIARGRQGNAAAVAVRSPYLRVVGMETDAEGAGRGGKRSFTPAEEEQMVELSRRPDIYEQFARSIAPSIYGFEGMHRNLHRVWCVWF
jgi:DNA replicative helicase MCM subunit Mcm2 (Cdc46/Mcm family)